MSDIDTLRDRLGEWRWLLLVATAFEAGVFRTLVADPSNSEALAARLGFDPRATYVVVEALAAGGFLAVPSGRYYVTDAARQLLVDAGGPAYLAPSLVHSRNLAARWLGLPDILRGNPSVTQRFSTTANFTETMVLAARATVSRIVDRCLAHFPRAHRIIDIGGGPGVHARAFAAAGRSVTILDFPAVIDFVRPQLAAEPAIVLVPGDFNVDDLPEGPFDLAFLGNVTHIYGPAENERLFRRIAAVLAPGGGIAIMDFVRGRSPNAALFAVNMLASTATGSTWTEKEYGSWLTAAGFRAVDVEDIATSPEGSGPERQLVFAR